MNQRNRLFKQVGQPISLITLILCISNLITMLCKKIYKTLTHKLLLSIIVSETVNAFTQIMSFPEELQKTPNYDLRKNICYTEIYLNIFTNFYTISSSAFLGIHLFNLLSNPDYNELKNNKLFIGISLYFSLFFAFFFWIIQMLYFQFRKDKYIKSLTCWVHLKLFYPIYIIIWIFNLINIIFFIRTYVYIKNSNIFLYLRNIDSLNSKEECEDDNNDTLLMDTFSKNMNSDNDEAKEHLTNIYETTKYLLYFPVATTFIWIGYTILYFLNLYYSMQSPNFDKAVVVNWFISIITVTRGIVYFLICLKANSVVQYSYYSIFRKIFCIAERKEKKEIMLK